MLATPLRVDDVLVGHLGWIATRVAIVSAAYLAVIAAFGVVTSPLAILALPAAVLTGLSFSAPIAAFAATQDGDIAFSTISRFALIPLFLFSGTFFPVSQLPGWLQPLAYATPLYHGVQLCRGLILGALPLGSAVGDVGYLVGLSVIGLLVARRTFAKRLVV
jgi:lipooligosaccharide transport system permease protein